MHEEELRLMVEVCKLYYEQDLSQREIGKRMYISRSKVSKLITKAKKSNVVSININDPFSEECRMADALREKYHLVEALVVDPGNASAIEVYKALARRLSVVLTRYSTNGSRIGISAGRTVAACSTETHIYNCRDLHFVPIIAGQSSEGEDWYANKNSARFAERHQGRYMVLNTPMIVREAVLRRQLTENPAVKPVFEAYEELDLILLGIGQTSPKSTLGCCPISSDEIEWAAEHGVKAIVGASYIDAGGNEVLKSQSDIFIGIKAGQIRRCPHVIAVALGMDKIEAIRATLKGEYVEVLCTDLATARKLIEG